MAIRAALFRANHARTRSGASGRGGLPRRPGAPFGWTLFSWVSGCSRPGTLGAAVSSAASSRSGSTQLPTLTSQVPASRTTGSVSKWLAGATGRTCRAACCTAR